MLSRNSLGRAAQRGERPIERASGWFPPKFLPGKQPQPRPAPYHLTRRAGKPTASSKDQGAGLLRPVGLPGKQDRQGGDNRQDGQGA